MKKKSFLVGILAMALVFGMAVAGCDNGSTDDGSGSTGGGSGAATKFDGSWTKSPYKVVISGTGYTIQVSETNFQKGTFSYNDTTVSFTGTHNWGSNSWVAGTFIPSTFGYTLNGNTLTLTLISAVNTYDTQFAGNWTSDGSNGNGGYTYSIGNTGPSGGIIFYVDTADVYPGWTYLEAAPTDVGVYKWGSGVYSSSLIGTSTAIGTGASNTATIVSTAGVNAPAAKACSDYIYGGKSDWFLPSKDELNLVFELKTVIGGFDYVNTTTYWSSSEYGASTTWRKGFIGSPWGNGAKDYPWSVRAIRAF